MDGKLSPGDMDKLLVFLEQNPDLAEELEGMKVCILEPINERYSNKEELKKTILSNTGNHNELDYLCIANLEGDISLEEKKRFDDLLSEDPTNKKLQSLYSKIKLIPDFQIIFNRKLSLKRNPIIKIKQSTLRNSMSIAAGFVLLLGIYSLFSLEKIDDNQLVLTTIETEQIHSIIEEETTYTEENIVTPENLNRQNEVQQKKLVEDEELKFLIEGKEEEKQFIACSYLEPKRLNQISFSRTTIEHQTFYFARLNETIINESYAEEVLFNNLPKGTSRTFNAFDLAQLGVQKLADFTGRPIELSAQKDQGGEVKSIRFESNLFAFSTSVKKNH
jgi:hypothetical protein